MKPPIIGNKINDAAVDSLIDTLGLIADADAVLYIGYPVAATAESPVTIPALFISKRYGFVCFDLRPSAVRSEKDKIKLRQREIALALKAKLLQNIELAGDEDLAFKVNVLTYTVSTDDNTGMESLKVFGPANLQTGLLSCVAFDISLLPHINATIERVANIRPKLKRNDVKRIDSKGAIIKKIEGRIANLDSWQKAAAIETPIGPQRIRGLAGTGKTVVLALKAAYLHGEKKDWKIAVTFHTRSLRQQFENLIKKFYYDDYREDVDADSLKIIHSFGSYNEPGVYSEICRAHGVEPKDFSYAKRRYGYNSSFQGVCAELLREVEAKPIIIFDAVLIDEAQDLPAEFLRLCYLCTRDHNIVWAYDDLQNLGDYQFHSLRETFGVDQAGASRVTLRHLHIQSLGHPSCH